MHVFFLCLFGCLGANSPAGFKQPQSKMDKHCLSPKGFTPRRLLLPLAAFGLHGWPTQTPSPVILLLVPSSVTASVISALSSFLAAPSQGHCRPLGRTSSGWWWRVLQFPTHTPYLRLYKSTGNCKMSCLRTGSHCISRPLGCHHHTCLPSSGLLFLVSCWFQTPVSCHQDNWWCPDRCIC